MDNPERLTILVKDTSKIEIVKNKIIRILHEIPVNENQYRIYVDTGERTVIHIVIEDSFVEQFVYEALNQQITFVATNSKVRRILDMLALDFEDITSKEKLSKVKKPNVDSDFDEFDFKDFDDSSFRIGKILSLTEPEEILDNVEQLEKEGEKIINRTTEVLRNSVETEIEENRNITTKDGEKRFEEALKRLKQIMTESLLTREELSDLSYRAGLSFIELVKGNGKYNEELKTITENEIVDEYIRVKAALTLIENMRKERYRSEDIKSFLNVKVLSELYDKQKDNFDNEEIIQLKSLLEY